MNKNPALINLKKNIVIGAIGNVFEWYDFIIYATLSPFLLIIFFPNSDKLISTILIFTLFVVGFIARPVGGTVFAYIADQYGRKKAFTLTILFTASPALLIALLPTYRTIGKAAALLLLAFRLLQGFAVGGEYPVLVSYIAEISPSRYRAYLCSYSNVTTVLGVLLATATVSCLNYILPHSAMLAWGWRIPFLITFLSVLCGFYMRLKMDESLVFSYFKKNIPLKNYFFILFNSHKSIIFKIFLSVICVSIGYYTLNVFMVIFIVQQAKLTYPQALNISIFTSLFLIVFIQLAGYLADKIGKKPILLSGLVGFIFFSYPLFKLFENCSYLVALMAQLTLSLFLSLCLGALPAYIAEHTNTHFRCSIFSLAYNLCLAFTGGTAPLVNLLLIHRLNNMAAPGIYLSVTGLISLLAILFTRETVDNNLISLETLNSEKEGIHGDFA